jgi:hypothetical protein
VSTLAAVVFERLSQLRGKSIKQFTSFKTTTKQKQKKKCCYFTLYNAKNQQATTPQRANIETIVPAESVTPVNARDIYCNFSKI